MRRFILLALLLAVAFPASPARAVPTAVVVSLNSATYYPGGEGRPDPLIVLEGTELYFAQLDGLIGHSITRYDTNVFDMDESDPGFFDTGVKPLGTVTAVPVVDTLRPGSYRFFCSIHPAMRGGFQII